MSDRRNRLHFFNPTCELAIENGDKNYTPPATLQQFENELACLPYIYATSGDAILTPQKTDKEELKHFNNLFNKQIDFISRKEDFEKYKNHTITPWSYAPNVTEQIKKCYGEIDSLQQFELPQTWNTFFKQLTSRQNTLEILNNATELRHITGFTPSFIGQIIKTEEELYTLLQKQPKLVLKTLWSSSGRGIYITQNGRFSQNQNAQLKKRFEQRKSILAEPLYQKQHDLSMHFTVNSCSEVDYLGISLFKTDASGRYIGTWINPDYTTFTQKLSSNPNFINDLANALKKAIQNNFTALLLKNEISLPLPTDFKMPIGVDMLTYKTDDNTLKLHPLVEINWRYTMGYTALAIEKQLPKDYFGLFKITRDEHWNERCRSFLAQNKTKNLFQSDFIPLTAWSNQQIYGAFLERDYSTNPSDCIADR